MRQACGRPVRRHGRHVVGLGGATRTTVRAAPRAPQLARARVVGLRGATVQSVRLPRHRQEKEEEGRVLFLLLCGVHPGSHRLDEINDSDRLHITCDCIGSHMTDDYSAGWEYPIHRQGRN